ncbi:MAG: hypothetical protein R3F43_12985 [bacterium]
MDLEWRSSGEPGGHLVVRSAALATLAWSVEVQTRPGEELAVATQGTGPVEEVTLPGGVRRLRWRGAPSRRAAPPCGWAPGPALRGSGRLAGPACSGARPRPR